MYFVLIMLMLYGLCRKEHPYNTQTRSVAAACRVRTPTMPVIQSLECLIIRMSEVTSYM